MHPELEGYARQTRASLAEIKELIDLLSRDQLLWRPSPKAWSIAECLAHLNLTLALYQDTLAGTIANARQSGLLGAGPFRYGWLSRLMIREIEPPPRRRFPANKELLPPADLDVAQLWPESQALRSKLLDLIAASDGLDLAKAKFRSPLLRILRLELGQGFAILCAHDRRHLFQAKRVREAEQFPR
jgi:hypothetical protein